MGEVFIVAAVTGYVVGRQRTVVIKTIQMTATQPQTMLHLGRRWRGEGLG